MSIINDALKKAEGDKRLTQGKSTPFLAPGAASNKDGRCAMFSRRIWTTATVIVVLLGIFLAVNFLPGRQGLLFKKKAAPDSVAKTSAGLFSMRKIDIESPFKAAGFRLSGILHEEQRPLAIINDRIVAVGAIIDGAELLEIRPDYVQLSRQGSEFKLRIK